MGMTAARDVLQVLMPGIAIVLGLGLALAVGWAVIRLVR